MKAKNLRKLAQARGILGGVQVYARWGTDRTEVNKQQRAIDMIEEVLDDETEDDE